MSFDDKLLVNSMDSGISLDNDNKILSETISEYKLIIKSLDIDKKYHDEQRKRLSKISDRKPKKNNIENCNVCFATLNTGDRKSCVPCCICSKIVCRGGKCSIWLPKVASWECQLCSLSNPAISRTNEWIDRQLITNKYYHSMSKSDIFLPFTENDSRSSLKSLSISNFDSASQTSSYGMEKERIREHVEDILAEMLGGSLDNISVGQLSKSQKYLPLYENENNYDNTSETTNNITEVSHIKLKRLIEKIIEETLRLPSIIDYSGIPTKDSQKRNDDDENSKYFDPKKYQELLATAVLNKIVDSYNYERKFENNSETIERNATNLDKNHNPIESKIERCASSSGDSFEPRSDSSLTDPIRDVSKCDNISPSDSCSNIYNASLNDDKESMLSDYLAGHKIPLPDLSTDSESAIDEFLSCPSNGNEKTWEDNWLFKKKKLNSTNSASSVGMLVPAPKEDIKTLIGDRTADEMSDLSDIEEDHIEFEINENGRIQNKHVIGGKSTVGIFDELLEETSMISSSSLYENEPIFTEAKNDYVLGNDGLHDIGNQPYYKFESDAIPIKNEAINSAITVEILKNSPPKKLRHPQIDNIDFDEPILPPPIDFNDNQIISSVDDTISGNAEQPKLLSRENSLPVISNTNSATTSFNNTNQQNQDDENKNQSNEVKSLRHSAVHFLATVALGPVLTICTPEVEEQIIKGINDRDLINFKPNENKSSFKTKCLEEGIEVVEENSKIDMSNPCNENTTKREIKDNILIVKCKQHPEIFEENDILENDFLIDKKETQTQEKVEKVQDEILKTDTIEQQTQLIEKNTESIHPEEYTDQISTVIHAEISDIKQTSIVEQQIELNIDCNANSQEVLAENNQKAEVNEESITVGENETIKEQIQASYINTESVQHKIDTVAEKNQIVVPEVIPQRKSAEIYSLLEQSESYNITAAGTIPQDEKANKINKTETSETHEVIVVDNEINAEKEVLSVKEVEIIKEQIEITDTNEESNINTKQIFSTKRQEEVLEVNTNKNSEIQDIAVKEYKTEGEVLSKKETTTTVEHQIQISDTNIEKVKQITDRAVENNRNESAGPDPVLELNDPNNITFADIISHGEETIEPNTVENIEIKDAPVKSNTTQAETLSNKETQTVKDQTQVKDSNTEKVEHKIDTVAENSKNESAEQNDSHSITSADTIQLEEKAIEINETETIYTQEVIFLDHEINAEKKVLSVQKVETIEEQIEVSAANEESNVNTKDIVDTKSQVEVAELNVNNGIQDASVKENKSQEILSNTVTDHIQVNDSNTEKIIIPDKEINAVKEVFSADTTQEKGKSIEINKTETIVTQEVVVLDQKINGKEEVLSVKETEPTKEQIAFSAVNAESNLNTKDIVDTQSQKKELAELNPYKNREIQDVIVKENTTEVETLSNKETETVEDQIQVNDTNVEEVIVAEQKINTEENVLSAEENALSADTTQEKEKVNEINETQTIVTQEVVVLDQNINAKEEVLSVKETESTEEQIAFSAVNAESNLNTKDIVDIKSQEEELAKLNPYENSEIQDVIIKENTTEIETLSSKETENVEDETQVNNTNLEEVIVADQKINTETNVPSADTTQEKEKATEINETQTIDSQEVVVLDQKINAKEEVLSIKETEHTEEQIALSAVNAESNLYTKDIVDTQSPEKELAELNPYKNREIQDVIVKENTTEVETLSNKETETVEDQIQVNNTNVEEVIEVIEINAVKEVFLTHTTQEKETSIEINETEITDTQEVIVADQEIIAEKEVLSVNKLEEAIEEQIECCALNEKCYVNIKDIVDTKSQEEEFAELNTNEIQEVIIKENITEVETLANKETVIHVNNSNVEEVMVADQEINAVKEVFPAHTTQEEKSIEINETETIDTQEVIIVDQEINAEKDLLSVPLIEEVETIEKQVEIIAENRECDVQIKDTVDTKSQEENAELNPNENSELQDGIIKENITAVETLSNKETETVEDQIQISVTNIEKVEHKIDTVAESNQNKSAEQNDSNSIPCGIVSAEIPQEAKTIESNETETIDNQEVIVEKQKIETQNEVIPVKESNTIEEQIEINAANEKNKVNTIDISDTKPPDEEVSELNVNFEIQDAPVKENKSQDEVLLNKETETIEDKISVNDTNVEKVEHKIDTIAESNQNKSAEKNDSNSIPCGIVSAEIPQERKAIESNEAETIDTQEVIAEEQEIETQKEVLPVKESEIIEEQIEVNAANEKNNVNTKDITDEKPQEEEVAELNVNTEIQDAPVKENKTQDEVLSNKETETVEDKISVNDTNVEKVEQKIDTVAESNQNKSSEQNHSNSIPSADTIPQEGKAIESNETETIEVIAEDQEVIAEEQEIETQKEVLPVKEFEISEEQIEVNAANEKNNVNTKNITDTKPQEQEVTELNVNYEIQDAPVKENKTQDEVLSNKETETVADKISGNDTNVEKVEHKINAVAESYQNENAEQIDSRTITFADTIQQEVTVIGIDETETIETQKVIVVNQEINTEKKVLSVLLIEEVETIEGQIEFKAANAESDVQIKDTVGTKSQEEGNAELNPNEIQDGIIKENITAVETLSNEETKTVEVQIQVSVTNIEKVERKIETVAECNQNKSAEQNDSNSIPSSDTIPQEGKVVESNEIETIDTQEVIAEEEKIETKKEVLPVKESEIIEEQIEVNAANDKNNVNTKDISDTKHQEEEVAELNVNYEIPLKENKTQDEILSNKKTETVEDKISVNDLNVEKVEHKINAESESYQNENAEQIDSNTIIFADIIQPEEKVIEINETEFNDTQKVNQEINAQKEVLSVPLIEKVETIEEQIEFSAANEESNVNAKDIVETKSEEEALEVNTDINSEIQEIPVKENKTQEEVTLNKETQTVENKIQTTAINGESNLNASNTKSQEDEGVEVKTNKNSEIQDFSGNENIKKAETLLNKETETVGDQIHVSDTNVEEIIHKIDTVAERENDNSEPDSLPEQSDVNNIISDDEPQEKQPIKINETETIGTQEVIIADQEINAEKEVLPVKEDETIEEQIECCALNEEGYVNTKEIVDTKSEEVLEVNTNKNSEIEDVLVKENKTQEEVLSKRKSQTVEDIIQVNDTNIEKFEIKIDALGENNKNGNAEQNDSNIITTKHIADIKQEEVIEVNTTENSKIEIQDVPVKENNTKEGVLKNKEITETIEDQTQVSDTNVKKVKHKMDTIAETNHNKSAEPDSMLDKRVSDNINSGDIILQGDDFIKANITENIDRYEVKATHKKNENHKDLLQVKQTVEEQIQVSTKNEENYVNTKHIVDTNAHEKEVLEVNNTENSKIQDVRFKDSKTEEVSANNETETVEDQMDVSITNVEKVEHIIDVVAESNPNEESEPDSAQGQIDSKNNTGAEIKCRSEEVIAVNTAEHIDTKEIIFIAHEIIAEEVLSVKEVEAIVEQIEFSSVNEESNVNTKDIVDTKCQEEILEVNSNKNSEVQDVFVQKNKTEVERNKEETEIVEDQIQVSHTNVEKIKHKIDTISEHNQSQTVESDSVLERSDSSNITAADIIPQGKEFTNITENVDTQEVIAVDKENENQKKVLQVKEIETVKEQIQVSATNEVNYVNTKIIANTTARKEEINTTKTEEEVLSNKETETVADQIQINDSNVEEVKHKIDTESGSKQKVQPESILQYKSAEPNSEMNQNYNNKLINIDTMLQEQKAIEVKKTETIESVIQLQEDEVSTIENIETQDIDVEESNTQEETLLNKETETEEVEHKMDTVERNQIVEHESTLENKTAELDSMLEQNDSNTISTVSTKTKDEVIETIENLEDRKAIVETKTQEMESNTNNIKRECSENKIDTVTQSNLIKEIEPKISGKENVELDFVVNQTDPHNISTVDTSIPQEKNSKINATEIIKIEELKVAVFEMKTNEEICLGQETQGLREPDIIINAKTEIVEDNSIIQKQSNIVIENNDSNNISTADTELQQEKKFEENSIFECESVKQTNSSSNNSLQEPQSEEEVLKDKRNEIINKQISVSDHSIESNQNANLIISTEAKDIVKNESEISALLSTRPNILNQEIDKKVISITPKCETEFVKSLTENSSCSNLTKIVSSNSELEKYNVRDEIDGCTSDSFDRTSSDSNTTDESTHTVLDVDEDIATTPINDDSNNNNNLSSGHSNILNNSNTNQANITNINDKNSLINNKTNNQNKLHNLKKSEFSKPLESDEDISEPLSNLVPGSIAEREHKKWYNAVEMPNNPYSPEALRRRLSNGPGRTFDIPNINPTSEETLSSLEDPNVSLEGDKTDFTRYSRDYYINENVQSTSPKKCISALNSVNIDDEDVKNEIVIKGNNEEVLSSTEYALAKDDNLKSINNLTDNSDIYSAKVIFIGESENTDKNSIYNINPSRNSDVYDNNNINNNNSDSLTPSEDSDTLRIYNLNKQETKLITKENINNNDTINNDNELISNESTTVPIPKPRPNNLQFMPVPLQSAAAARIVTPTSFKFLQPKRKLIEPSQIMSMDSNPAYPPGTPERQVIEDDVIKNLPSVKALAQAFLLTTKSVQNAKRPKSLPADFECSTKYEPLPTEITSEDQEVEITTTPPSTPVLEDPESDAIDRPVSPVLTPGKLKDNIAFFENLKKK